MKHERLGRSEESGGNLAITVNTADSVVDCHFMLLQTLILIADTLHTLSYTP